MKRLLTLALVAVLVVPAGAASAAGDKQRIFGATRVETSVEISRESFPDAADVVYLSRSDVFADALAAGTLADGPVLLVPSCDDLPPAVTNRIADLDPAQVIALGGPGAICDRVLQAAAGGRSTGRVAGTSRYDTAVAISQRAFPDGAQTVYVASAADTAPDAVSGGILDDGPILLVPGDPGASVPSSVLAEASRLTPTRVVALGGSRAVNEAHLRAVAAGITTSRLAGDDRYATAVQIARRRYPPRQPVPTVYLAQAFVFADAVSAGSLRDGPVLLVPPCGEVPADVVRYLQEATPARVVALGGQRAICDELLDAAAKFTTSTEYIDLDVDGAELRLDATKPYVLVSDVPDEYVSLVFHDYSRGFKGRVMVEVYDTYNQEVLRSSLADSEARYVPIMRKPGRYVTRLTPVDVEPGAQIRAVATSWTDPGLRPDTGSYRHAPDRFGSGLAIPVQVTDPRPWEWMSVTGLDNIVDVYSERAEFRVMAPDGTLSRPEPITEIIDAVSLRFPTPTPGTYTVLLDPRENRIRTTVSIDRWPATSLSLGSATTFVPDRIGDGATWRFSASVRRWMTVAARGDHGCEFELDLLDANNEVVGRADCDRQRAYIPIEIPATGAYTALLHHLDQASHRVELTPWEQAEVTIDDGVGHTVEANGRIGRGGVISFDGELSQAVTVRVDHPTATSTTRPRFRLERPSGVYLLPHTTDTRTSHAWSSATYELPEPGTYRVIVDNRGYEMNFTVTVNEEPE